MNKAQRAIIKAEAESRGCKYRITRDGEVHFHGQMPNSIESGWWVFGLSVEEALDEIAGHLLDDDRGPWDYAEEYEAGAA